MCNRSIVVVDDEEDILELVSFNLQREGFKVRCCSCGEELLRLLRTQKPDAVILDLMLPGMSGLDLCRKLKSDPVTAPIPILVISAKSSETDIVLGLELGADDYVTKPFSPRVLLARLRSLLREKNDESEKSAAFQVNKLKIDAGRHEAQLADEKLDLSLTEFRLLHWLASKPGRVHKRGEIVRGVHGEDYPVTERSIDVQIMSLRKKLGAHDHYIETVRGVGYRFKDLSN